MTRVMTCTFTVTVMSLSIVLSPFTYTLIHMYRFVSAVMVAGTAFNNVGRKGALDLRFKTSKS